MHLHEKPRYEEYLLKDKYFSIDFHKIWYVQPNNTSVTAIFFAFKLEKFLGTQVKKPENLYQCLILSVFQKSLLACYFVKPFCFCSSVMSLTVIVTLPQYAAFFPLKMWIFSKTILNTNFIRRCNCRKKRNAFQKDRCSSVNQTNTKFLKETF